ncbi:DUF1496 domain-containing protein [Photobacterium lipolyticum]|uniref:DUF1496 domain-containing protein n=1 Tax=Photobacterium lipolyticum TaxID=266810 RepID=A0A2T3MYV5_9GAMM|nr:DUF1496 domain-containing protein [Photobacterium lipolyticum]PSW05080.1 DUF1496 domain-containing protein [Photobacterium lipolyticum]
MIKATLGHKSVRAVVGLVVLLMSFMTESKVVGTNQNQEISVENKMLIGRACLYDGKEYSSGAVIVIKSIALKCLPENSFETNGKLHWKEINKLEK